MARLQRSARSRYVQYFIEEVRNAASCLGACQSRIYKQQGLRAEQWRALVAINRSSFTMSISVLARNLRLARQSVHSMVLGLERAGWIRLLRNPDDRRLVQIEMTDRGRSLIYNTETRLGTWLLLMTFDLSERELIKLIHTLRSIRARIARSRDYA